MLIGTNPAYGTLHKHLGNFIIHEKKLHCHAQVAALAFLLLNVLVCLHLRVEHVRQSVALL